MNGKEAEYLTREMHEGVARAHEGARTIVRKIARVGYYWLSMYQDIEDIIYKFDKYHNHAPIQRKSAMPMISISSP